MPRINSRRKGANGEREAAAFLTSLGLEAKRSVQNGVEDGRDIYIVAHPHIYFEVKRDNTVNFGTKAFDAALEQAKKKANGNPCFLLWRRDGECWKLTFDEYGMVATYYREQDILTQILWYLPGIPPDPRHARNEAGASTAMDKRAVRVRKRRDED